MLGIYDSGVGGLAYLKHLQSLDPTAKCMYLADSASMPMGEKSLDQIRVILTQGLTKLFKRGCELVVLACNTATVNNIRYLQQVWLPEQDFSSEFRPRILGVSQPLLELLEDRRDFLGQKTGLLLSTQATYLSGFYQSEAKQRGYVGLQFMACNGLAEMVERDTTSFVGSYLKQIFKDSKIDLGNIEYLVLACTHYEWIQDELAAFFTRNTLSRAEDLEILAPSKVAAAKLLLYMQKHKVSSSYGENQFLTTSSSAIKPLSDFLERNLGLTEKFTLLD